MRALTEYSVATGGFLRVFQGMIAQTILRRDSIFIVQTARVLEGMVCDLL